MKRPYQKKEESLHQAVCKFIKSQYPDVIFSSESGGIRLTMGQAIKAKSLRSEAKLPDLMIFEARGGYHGLLIEIKKETVFLKDGSLSKDKHVQGQAAILDRLSRKGYHAVFGCGIDNVMMIINSYLAGRLKIEDTGTLVDEWYK